METTKTPATPSVSTELAAKTIRLSVSDSASLLDCTPSAVSHALGRGHLVRGFKIEEEWVARSSPRGRILGINWPIDVLMELLATKSQGHPGIAKRRSTSPRHGVDTLGATGVESEVPEAAELDAEIVRDGSPYHRELDGADAEAQLRGAEERIDELEEEVFRANGVEERLDRLEEDAAAIVRVNGLRIAEPEIIDILREDGFDEAADLLVEELGLDELSNFCFTDEQEDRLVDLLMDQDFEPAATHLLEPSGREIDDDGEPHPALLCTEDAEDDDEAPTSGHGLLWAVGAGLLLLFAGRE